MPLFRRSRHDDELTRYLLGTLSEDETNRVDELSIVDEEVAERLRVLEDDLVDAYASGTLKGETLQRFESFYLASPRHRAKADFARRLQRGASRTPQRRATVHRLAPATNISAARVIPWARSAAAVLVLVACALMFDNVNLRRNLQVAEGQTAMARQNANAATAELEAQRKAKAIATQALADARGTRPAATVALVLRPETRGVGPTSIISIAPGSTMVPLDLQFEATGPGPYEVVLRDPASNQVVWRSAATIAPLHRRPAVVSVGVPAALLKAQHYAVDLFDVHKGSPPEFVASYAFEVARP